MLNRIIEDSAEYYMHGFLDCSNEKGIGLAIANNSKYAFNIEEGRVQVTVARSSIYAQGNSKNWYNEKESYEYLADSAHKGKENCKTYSFASTDCDNVLVMLVKMAEEDEDYIVRLLETSGKDSKFTLQLLSHSYDLNIGHHEIKTVKINSKTKSIIEVNLLEWIE